MTIDPPEASPGGHIIITCETENPAISWFKKQGKMTEPILFGYQNIVVNNEYQVRMTPGRVINPDDGQPIQYTMNVNGNEAFRNDHFIVKTIECF